MKFEDLRIKSIELVTKYETKKNYWVAKNRTDHIMGIIFSGRELHDFGDRKFTMTENCIYFLNQKDDYTVYVEEHGLCHSVHFTTEEPVDTDSFCIKVNNPTEIIQLLEKIERQKQLSLNGTHRLLSSVYKLCAMFHDIREKKYSPVDARMVAAREYIDLHFKDADCLKDAYGILDLSRRHFDQLFKTNFDVTPSRYITGKRIEFAKQLLKTPNLNMEEIALMCGFGDQYYFSKVFKSETNITPTEFKRTLL